jgi:hypothetical protein
MQVMIASPIGESGFRKSWQFCSGSPPLSGFVSQAAKRSASLIGPFKGL